CSVLLIRWSQETRMYAQAAALIALAAYATLRAQSEPQRRRWWVLIVVGSAGAMLTHYLGALAVGLLNIYALLSLRPHQWATQRGAVVRWLVAMLAVAVLVGAWVVYALPLIRSGSVGGEFDAGFVFQLAASLFAVGTSTQITELAALTLVITLGALVGLALSPRRDSVGLVLLFALAPPLVIYTLGVLETRFYSPKPEERYFILFAPVLVAGIGVAVASLTRRRWLMPLGIALAVVVIGVQDAAGHRAGGGGHRRAARPDRAWAGGTRPLRRLRFYAAGGRCAGPARRCSGVRQRRPLPAGLLPPQPRRRPAWRRRLQLA
ncbi:MAG: glycosyltransferase family 39 protein, partial [Anaerolineae bacterium]|nr:glycosyltransferase family 39 protein [Anaerolineae bacterium]